MKLIDESITCHFKALKGLPLGKSYFYNLNPDFVLELVKEYMAFAPTTVAIYLSNREKNRFIKCFDDFLASRRRSNTEYNLEKVWVNSRAVDQSSAWSYSRNLLSSQSEILVRRDRCV